MRGLDRVRGSIFAAACAALALAALGAPDPAAAPASQASLCAEPTPLALLGLDTEAGLLLFDLPVAGGRTRQIEVALGRAAAGEPGAAGPDAARSFRAAPAAAHYAGSVGPGPIFALARCGDGCLAAERWQGGRWEPLGSPLEIPGSANLYATYDRSGRPWIVAHLPGPERWIEARAWRFEDGAWKPKGELAVHGPTALGVAPASWQRDAVVSGSGLFSAGAPPVTWAAGLPTLPPEKHGQIVPNGETGAVYMAADGALYWSADRGAAWRGTRFKPWGVERTEIWAYGVDYSVDLPLGTHGEPLPLAWFDRRGGRSGKVFLTELEPGGEWRLRGEVPADLQTTAEPLELVHLLRKDAGEWVLLSDCFRSGGKPAVALRTWSPAGLGEARVLGIREERP